MKNLENYTIEQLYDLIGQAKRMIKYKEEERKELWDKVVDAIEEYRKVDNIYITERNEQFYCIINRENIGEFILDDN